MTGHRQITVTLDRIEAEALLDQKYVMGPQPDALHTAEDKLRTALHQTPSGEECCPWCGGDDKISVVSEAATRTLTCKSCGATWSPPCGCGHSWSDHGNSGCNDCDCARTALGGPQPSGEACEKCHGEGLVDIINMGSIETRACPNGCPQEGEASQPSGEEGGGEEAEDWPKSVVIRRYTDLHDEFWAAAPPADGTHDVVGQEARRYFLAAHPHDQEAPR